MPTASLINLTSFFVCSGLSLLYVSVIVLPNSFDNAHLEEYIAILSLNSARGVSHWAVRTLARTQQYCTLCLAPSALFRVTRAGCGAA